LKFLYLILSLLLLCSCTQKQANIKSPIFDLNKTAIKSNTIVKKVIAQQNIETIDDLQWIPQDVSFYAHNIEPSYLSTQKKYEKDFFRVWNLKKVSTHLSDALWANKAFTEKNSYGENLQKISKSFFDTTEKNANYKEFKTLNLKAISLKELNIRAFPSIKPLFLNPEKAGEGFPFDYLQNSTIAPNKPLLVSHYSQDREWAFVESSFTFGWVKSSDIALLDKKYTDIWQKAKQVFITKDDVPIYSKNGNFLFHSKIGMMLALIGEDEDSYRVLTIAKYKNEKPLYTEAKLSKNIAHLGILEFNQKNIIKILGELSQSHYGWGGFNSERDCSSILRDFYAPFGLWLPRNSYQQSKSAESISLEKLTNNEKIQIIKKEAEPFKTLLYKKGHIVLYIGVYKKKIIIFQNVWGVKTMKDAKEGRFVIGKAIFSTLELGKNLKEFDTKSSLLENLQSMTKL